MAWFNYTAVFLWAEFKTSLYDSITTRYKWKTTKYHINCSPAISRWKSHTCVHQALSFKSAKKDRQKERKKCVKEVECGVKIEKKSLSQREESTLDWGADLQKTWPWPVWIMWLCGRVTYSTLHLRFSFQLLGEKKEGQEVSQHTVNKDVDSVSVTVQRDKTSLTDIFYCANASWLNGWLGISSYTIVPPSGINGRIHQGLWAKGR